MGLFLVVFWCASITCAILRFNSRFGVFNSRLGALEFPFSRQREFAGKRLIFRVVFVAERHFSGAIEKIRGSTGLTGKSISRLKGWRCNLRRPFSVARAATEPAR
jgi:hypothetical protein